MEEDIMSTERFGKDLGELENFIILVSSYMRSDTKSNPYMHLNVCCDPVTW